ncbi:uncharacterized protein CLUP02_04229 [Colletotrichum lupini]|uniref:Uncharacterized protein n=1 Tax=Colletotrichum lupini TaxID=145971 RepID=A0A9Q8SLP8_9PEZI|nr:uncharacterized protein CLUP02_04229 [Colletotrichum lupini]UQC78752.1 hypothetical protein CLUP02_04229 [Colletotrichum lupini]
MCCLCDIHCEETRMYEVRYRLTTLMSLLPNLSQIPHIPQNSILTFSDVWRNLDETSGTMVLIQREDFFSRSRMTQAHGALLLLFEVAKSQSSLPTSDHCFFVASQAVYAHSSPRQSTRSNSFLILAKEQPIEGQILITTPKGLCPFRNTLFSLLVDLENKHPTRHWDVSLSQVVVDAVRVVQQLLLYNDVSDAGSTRQTTPRVKHLDHRPEWAQIFSQQLSIPCGQRRCKLSYDKLEMLPACYPSTSYTQSILTLLNGVPVVTPHYGSPTGSGKIWTLAEHRDTRARPALSLAISYCEASKPAFNRKPTQWNADPLPPGQPENPFPFAPEAVRAPSHPPPPPSLVEAHNPTWTLEDSTE